MFFQTIDDKQECVGVYYDGKLYYDNFPDALTHTWKYTGSLQEEEIEYACLYAGGLTLSEACPAGLEDDLARAQKRLRAYLKSFQIAKIDMRNHCVFDMVPEDFLKQFCEIKNKITEHVFNTYEKPLAYAHLQSVQKLLHKIRYQNLNLNNENCKELYYLSSNRSRANMLIQGPQYIDYNMFGTVTGRLTTHTKSFPILTVRKDFRKLLKPHNEWFLSLDYNAAEVRTFIALAGEEQPQEDVHQWHIKNLIKSEISREESKVKFFAWIYNPDSNVPAFAQYKREEMLEHRYDGSSIETLFKRKIKVDKRKALNYLIQSTTADLVLDRAIAVDEFLKDKKSFISHIVHDEIVIDLADSERDEVPEIKALFAENKLDTFLVNLSCGKNYYDLKELDL